MDNVTHSLAGLLLAESALRVRARRTSAEPSAALRAVAAVSSVIGANLPDADLFYTGFGGDRLRYMLHHRGHTHTVVIALLGGVLLWAAALGVWRWRARETPMPNESRWLVGLLIVCTLSHLVLDWTNSYGVHPFWPVDDRWRYGDAVFIIEPWLWVVAVPALVVASTRRVTKLVLSIVLVAAILLAWNTDLVSKGAAAALTVGAVLSITLASILRANGRVAAAVAGWVIVTVLMAAGAARARAISTREARAGDPTAALLDVVVSPLPANPLCMSVITVELSGETYRVVTGRATPVPSIAEPSHCEARQALEPMLAATTRRSTAAIHWDREWTASRAELANLVLASCSALAAMRFIRVPIWRAVDDSTVLLGDVRYGGGSGNGFTDVRVPRQSAHCPDAVPPWTPPRADLWSVMRDW